MAIFTSANGYFEITALSFSPSIVASGEKTTYSITIKNISGVKINNGYITLGYRYASSTAYQGSGSAQDVYVHGGPNFAFASLSWANNASKTFTGEYTPKFNTAPDATGRICTTPSSGNYAGRGLHLSITTDADFATGNFDNFFDMCGASNEYFAMLTTRYNPKITNFDLQRCTNGALDDEGESVLTDLSLYLPDDAAYTSGFTLKLYYAQGAEPSTSSTPIELTSYISQARTGIIDSTTLITNTFSKAYNYKFLLVFGDAYESTSWASTDLARSFANVHLSGDSEGGVCFGGFCKNEKDATNKTIPKFECYYPAYFYGGIAQGGVKDYSSERIDTGIKWIDGKTIYRKVLSFSALTGDKKTNVYIDETSSISTVVSYTGMAHNSSGYWWSMPHFDRTYASYSIIIEIAGVTSTTPYVSIYPGKSRGITGGFVIVEYTLA